MEVPKLDESFCDWCGEDFIGDADILVLLGGTLYDGIELTPNSTFKVIHKECFVKWCESVVNIGL